MGRTASSLTRINGWARSLIVLHSFLKTLSNKLTYWACALNTLRQEEIVNYNEWTVPLDRRFRALKLWFTLRAYGLEALRGRIRNHNNWSRECHDIIADMDNFTITSAPAFSLFTFCYKNNGAVTEDLLARINDDSRIYLTQIRHAGQFVVRMQIGQFDCTREDVMVVPTVLKDLTGGQ